MAFIEQLIYGINPQDETAGRYELAHSAGMGAEVGAEIHELCEAWGQAPDLGLQTPVLISHPLQSSMPSMRGRLHAIIRGTAGEKPLFHAVVLNDATFSGYGRNPYAVANAVEFATIWNGKQGMDRVEIDPDRQGALIDPVANEADITVVSEAVMHFVVTGKLSMPIEQAVTASDRAMALILASLPDEARKSLKFASFTCTKAHSYDVASVETEGATFAGWQRLLLSQIDTGISEQQKEYKRLISEHLSRGDLVGVARVSQRHSFVAPVQVQQVVSTRPRVEKPPIQTPAAAIVQPASSLRNGSPVAMAATGGPAQSRFVPHDGHGLDPANSKPSGRSATRKRSRVRSHLTKGQRGSGSKFLRATALIALLFIAGWVGTMWLEGRTLTESLEWAGLPGMDGGTEKVEHAGTLLEVVDVGRVYERALKNTGGKGFGLNASGDKGREMALGRLRTDAVAPLVAQVGLFTKLAADGIQQSGRPDREVERLGSLAKQGVVLDKEMDRLELAWFSIASGKNWHDLGKLNDDAISARRDSLARVEKGVLSDVRIGMGTDKSWQSLKCAQRRMIGMAEVVRLFHVRRWSDQWETDLAAAAEMVSPSAGQTTRAYRNSAFAMVRLKRAEREAAHGNLPYAGRFESDQWPSAAVKSILPILRKEAGRFSDQNAPALLGATLGLYTSLSAPDDVVDKFQESGEAWESLQENRAVRFDRDFYGGYLERLRFEAAGRQFGEARDESAISNHLYQGGLRHEVMAFTDSLAVLTKAEQWLAVAEQAEDPFLKSWADHLAHNLEARLARLQQEFDQIWTDCRAQATALQAQAKAGYDWSGQWQELRSASRSAIETYGETLSEDPGQAGRFEYLSDLLVALDAARPLRMARVTVRFEQDLLESSLPVQLELRTPVRGGVWTSEPFDVGPAAPVGTGWVGTASLAWDVELSARHHLTARVVSAEEQGTLLEVDYPSLADGGGPALLARPRAGEQGNLSFKVELTEYWSGVEVPELGLFF